jgi:hypothetical protein
MPDANRQDAEHRLANLVAQWISAREQKAADVAEHNEAIKGLEEAIAELSAEIKGGQFQPTLPLGGTNV